MALLALAMAALMPQKAQAQDRIPFLAEGKTWTVFNYDARYEGALVVKDSARYSVLGDTLVGGRTCKLVETEIGTVPAYQEGRNIYFYYPDDAEPRVMYEFDCQVGDLVHVDSEREARAEVTKVDSLCLGGTYYRVVHYRPPRLYPPGRSPAAASQAGCLYPKRQEVCGEVKAELFIHKLGRFIRYLSDRGV